MTFSSALSLPTMRNLDTLDAQADLLPKRRSELFLVLFYRSSDASFIPGSCNVEPIDSFELVSVDLDNAPRLAERFVLPTLPVLAAVFDGSILCLEHQLTDSTCRELAEVALRQQKSLLEFSS